jgi:hypothetical protein
MALGGSPCPGLPCSIRTRNQKACTVRPFYPAKSLGCRGRPVTRGSSYLELPTGVRNATETWPSRFAREKRALACEMRAAANLQLALWILWSGEESSAAVSAPRESPRARDLAVGGPRGSRNTTSLGGLFAEGGNTCASGIAGQGMSVIVTGNPFCWSFRSFADGMGEKSDGPSFHASSATLGG